MKTQTSIIKIHKPMELLYALFALGTKHHYLQMINEYNLEPNEILLNLIVQMEENLSRYLAQELTYFFDLDGLGYILYKLILANEPLNDVSKLIEQLSLIDENQLIYHILESVCKDDIDSIHPSTSKDQLISIVKNTNFQSKQRQLNVLDAIENPLEFKQRLYLFINQFYDRCYKPIEHTVYSYIEHYRAQYDTTFHQDQGLFLNRYLSTQPSELNHYIIHLSLFKYIGYHHYALVDDQSTLWFVLGVHSDDLFNNTVDMETFATFFKSLSDINRIHIIKLLSDRPHFGQELAEKLNITPATVSYHINFLQQMNMVTFKRIDNRSYYELNNLVISDTLNQFIRYTQQ